MKQALNNAGASVKIVSKFGGTINSADGQEIEVDKPFVTTASVMYDAVYVPGGEQSIKALKQQGDAIHFINEAFKHCKAITATGEGVELLKASNITGVELSEEQLKSDKGVVTVRNASDMQSVAQQFIQAIAQHRHWMREHKEMVPA
jgi:catalase